MKDYTETDFQKRTFIIRYTINHADNLIEVYYADGDTTIMPYTAHNEIMILDRMRRQVLNYSDFKDKAKVDRIFFRIKKYLCLGGACFGTVVLANLGYLAISVGTAGIGFIPSLTINGLMILVMKKYYDASDDEIIRINNAMKDYDKSIFYLRNEKVFADERIKRHDVITRSPEKVRRITKEREEYHLTDEIPSINLNSIDDLTTRELERTYEASLQSHGPEKKLVKK